MYKNGMFVKVEHKAEVRNEGNFFAFRGKGKSYAYRFIESRDLEIPKNYRICSFEDNEDKYRAVLVQYCKDRINKLEEQLEKEKAILLILEEEKYVSV